MTYFKMSHLLTQVDYPGKLLRDDREEVTFSFIRVSIYINPLTPNDIYIYMSYRTANLQTLNFIYLVNKYTY
jgi:hypothetical protein